MSDKCSIPPASNDTVNATVGQILQRLVAIEEAITDMQDVLEKLLLDTEKEQKEEEEDSSSDSEDMPPPPCRRTGSQKRSTRSSTRR